MPSIAELNVGVGDWVTFEAERHGSPEEFRNSPTGRLSDEKFIKRIVGIDGDDVYLYPWDKRLSAFTRVQNVQNGKFYPIKTRVIENQRRWEPLPLDPNERLVLIMNGQLDCFHRFVPSVHKPSSNS